MTTEYIESNDQQLAPKIADKYAEYYDINQDAEETGISEEVKADTIKKPVDDKPLKQTEPKQTEEPSPEEKPEHKPKWQKRIDKQTAKIRLLEEELRQVREGKKQEVTPKYKRENFVTEEDYDAYTDKRQEGIVSAKIAEMRERQLEQTIKQQRDEEFNNSWQEKVATNFTGDNEGYAEFAGMIRTNAKHIESWHEDVHDFMEATDVGPRIMQVLLYRPDLVHTINTAKPIVRTKMLMQLEGEISNAMRGQVAIPESKPQPRPVSKAPTPIGAVGTGNGSALSEEESEDLAYQRYMNKKFRGK